MESLRKVFLQQCSRVIFGLKGVSGSFRFKERTSSWLQERCDSLRPRTTPRCLPRGNSLGVATLVSLSVVSGAAHADIESARAKGLAWLVKAQRGDGSFAGAMGLSVQATAAVVEAMQAGGLSGSPQYGRALSWLANTSAESTDARSWQVMALAAAGRDANAIANSILDERNTVSVSDAAALQTGFAVWGSFPNYGASLPDTVLAYGALRAAALTYANHGLERVETVLCHILPAQLSAAPWAGSWPYAAPRMGHPDHIQRGSLISTALTLYELKKQRLANRFSTTTSTKCGRSSPADIDASMSNAKAWLIAQANSDGGFADRNPLTGSLEPSSPVASALAIRALALFAAEGDTASVTAVSNAQGWLTSQQTSEGSWRGDPFVTARVLAALPAATGNAVADTDGDGLPDLIEAQLSSESSVANSQELINDQGNAVPGVTTYVFSVNGSLNALFNHAIDVAFGSAPYSHQIVNGILPPGLSMTSAGAISGTPTTLGSFAFDDRVVNAEGRETIVIGRITISSSQVAGDVNGDGIVDVADVALVQRYVLGLSTLDAEQISSADLSPPGAPDGQLGVADLEAIVREVLQLD
jgi:hypothetical protein